MRRTANSFFPRMACPSRSALAATLVLSGFCWLAAGCTVGPDFKAPAPPTAAGYTKEPLTGTSGDPSVPGGEAQTYAVGQDIPAQWWALYRSPVLDGLVRRAIANSPDLQSAQAALRVAMENVKAQIGAYYPTVTGGVDASRNKNAVELSPTLSSPVLLFNLYQAQLGATWTLDIWGGNKRQVEALNAQADAQRYQLQATYVALTSNIVAAAVQEAALREQIDVSQQMLAVERQILDIEQRQKSAGQIAGLDLAAQEAAVAVTEASIPPLEKQLAQQRDLLAALAGQLPSDEMPESFTLGSLTLPSALPVSLPSRLVEQRSDIKVAEANLHAASAQIGVAIANMLPNVTLSANDGTVATGIGHLLSPGNGFWSVGAGVTQPIFEGGTLLHRSRAARAMYEQAAAQYRGTVITAFQNVADALEAIQSDGATLAAAANAARAADKSLAISRNQMELGQIGHLAIMNAQQTYLQARLSLVQAQSARLSDTATLFQALGGGWWNRNDLAPGEAAK